jgi:large subunit ribosomal protein L22
MEAKAIAKTVRVAPRKARLVVDFIRGKKVGEAFAILKHTPNHATEAIEKVLKSAVANAEHNLKLDVNKLFVKETFANAGATLKRFRPRAKGSGAPIMKRTSHITVVVAELEK